MPERKRLSLEMEGSKWASEKHRMLKSKKLSLIKSILFRILLIFLYRIDKSAEMFGGPGFCSNRKQLAVKSIL